MGETEELTEIEGRTREGCGGAGGCERGVWDDDGGSALSGFNRTPFDTFWTVADVAAAPAEKVLGEGAGSLFIPSLLSTGVGSWITCRC